MPRTEFLSAIRRDRHFVRQQAVLVFEDLQRARILRLVWSAFVAPGHQNGESIVWGDAYLMGVDAGIDRTGLLHLFARREVLVDTVDAHRARIVECYQDMFRRNVGADVDRARRQPYRRAVRCQSPARRVNGKGRDVMLGAAGGVTRSAAAACDIEIASRRMRPRILHSRRQGYRRPPGRFRAGDVDLVVRQIGTDIGVKRHFLRSRLRDRQSGHGNARSNS